MSTPADLQALFANLKPRPSSSGPSQPSNAPSSTFDPAMFLTRQASYQQAASPSIQASSQVASPLPSGSAGGPDRAQSLLSLLKSAQPVKDTSQDKVASENTISASSGSHGRGISASDLVASFMGTSGAPTARQSVPPPSANTPGFKPSETSQNALLQLLNRSQASSSPAHVVPQPARVDSYRSDDVLPSVEQETVVATNGREPSPIRVFGSTESKETTPFEPVATSTSTQKEKKPIFTYTNPFETLTAISRNQTPQPQRTLPQSPALSAAVKATMGEKRDSEDRSPEPSSSRRKLTPRLRKIPSAADSIKKETVSEKLEALADEASQAAEDALADALYVPIKEESFDEKVDIDALADKLEETAIEAAVEMKNELDKPENKGILENELTTPLARDVRYIIDSAAENANGNDLSSFNATGDERVVPVYNFPIKPFVSITLKLPENPAVGPRDDGVMEISRFKKEFDQLDRSLAAATSKYITYALVKSGGMRVIRQDDGSDRQIFKNSHDRIFNVAMCSTAANSTPTEEQAILGTGIGGSVYYATIFRNGNDLFEQDALESEILIFPPFPLGDENTSGGQLKTRAKKSSRHPEFFAIGRGKHIYLVWPTLAMSSKYGVQGANRKVDVEKFYKERTLKITTGKAGKDFSFSEDDTTIVSLDKAGRLRFWDIRQLIDESNATAPKLHPIDIRLPLLTLSTVSASEKIWPTSALFIDKLRPYTKATALRYVLVGLRQNHTLQLWDISLGKAVEEINFPHDTENDGICSICYHPGSGIIVVGHPTRNSIYFIHLSAPRYGLPPMSQATYIERLAVKDPDLPKPESTACMSGIREMSFGSKGQLRSVELLPVHKTSVQTADEAPALFELYVVHSRGVTCLNIKKQDLGWNEESKTTHPINALEKSFIDIRGLDVGSVAEADNEANGEAEAQPSAKASKKKSQKAAEPVQAESSTAAARESSPEKKQPDPSPSNREPVNGNEQTTEPTMSKKKKKKAQQQVAATLPPPQTDNVNQTSSRSVSPQKGQSSTAAKPEVPASGQPQTSTTAAPVPDSSSQPLATADGPINVGISGNWLNKEMRKLESGVTTALKKDFEGLHRQIDMERKVQDTAASTRQEAMLRLISETLSDNVEKSLARIVISNFQQAVIPALTNATAQSVESVLVRHLHGIIPNELGKHLPTAISAGMSNPRTLMVLTESVSQKIAHSVENAFTELMHTTVTPSFKNLAVNTAGTMSAEVERRVSQQIQNYEAERRVDRQKIDDVMDTVNNMAKTLADMARSQIEFQQKILQDRRSSGPVRPENGEASPTEKSPMELEGEEIKALIQSGDYHNATIQWLKSDHQMPIFDQVFAPMGPGYLASEVAPLVAFSVAITLSNNFSGNIRAKIDWIDRALQCIDIRDPEIATIADQATQILADLVSKLESCYMSIHQQNTGDPLLKSIPSITKRAKELRLAFARGSVPAGYRYGA